MADAFKCDRCGAFYTKNNVICGMYIVDNDRGCRALYDLCDDCISELERFLNMAVAKKCDICRKLYEEYNVKQSKDNFNGFMLLNIDYIGNYFHSSAYDCCPECMKSIREHINSLMKKEE